MSMIINPYVFGSGTVTPPGNIPLTNLRVWLESTDNVIYSGVSPFNVTAWNHVQALGTNNALTSSGRNPNYVASGSTFVNKPYLQFNQPQEDIMSIAYNSNLDFSANGFTIYMVASIAAWNTLSFYLAHTNDAVLTQGWGFFYINNKLRFFINNWNNVNNYMEINANALNQRALYKFTWNKSVMTCSYRQLGNTVAGSKPFTGPYTNPSGFPATIMSLPGGTFSINDTSGDVAAIVMYNGVLNATDEAAVESYLRAKYNIS